MLFPYTVSESTYEALCARYPVLASGTPESRVLGQMLTHAVWSTFQADPLGADEPTLLLPRVLVADWVGARNPSDERCIVQDWIRRFAALFFPLNATDWNWEEHRCRRIRPAIPEDLLALRDGSLRPTLRSMETRVEVATGEQQSRRSRRVQVAEYVTQTRARHPILAEHPARPLADVVERQPTATLDRIVARNWNPAAAAVLAMPVSRRRDGAVRAMAGIQETREMIYAPSGRTPRLHAIGPSVNALPKEIRQILLAGCPQLDLVSSHIAIAARVLEVPPLLTFLEKSLAGGPTFWEQLYADLRLDPASKPRLKRASHSVTYGKLPENLRKYLIDPDADSSPALTPVQAEALLTHRLIAPLLEARDRMKVQVGRQGGMADCFGRWIPYVPNEQPARSVLAQAIQAEELQVMMSVLPVIQESGDTQIVTWLHDGLVVHTSNQSKEARRIRQLEAAITQAAQGKGFPTKAEITIK